MTKSKELIKAIDNKDIDKIKLLLKYSKVNPCYNNNYAIKASCEYGFTDIVELLLKDKRVDPSDGYNYALHSASDRNLFDIVRLLMNDQRVDPSDCQNWAIINSSDNKNEKMVKLLWENKKIKNTLKNDCLLLYNKLIIDDIKNKVSEF